MNEVPKWLSEAFDREGDLEIIRVPLRSDEPDEIYECPKHGLTYDAYFEVSVLPIPNPDHAQRNFMDQLAPFIGKYCIICYAEFFATNLQRLVAANLENQSE